MENHPNPDEFNWFEVGMDILARLQWESWAEEDPGTPAISAFVGRPESGWSELVGARDIQRPSIQSLLADLGPTSHTSLLIGACEDGLPVIVDLSYLDANPLIILGGPRSGKTSLLLSILKAACHTNSPRQLRFACISTKLPELDPVLSEPHCYRFSDPYDDLSVDLLRELSGIASRRAQGKDAGPAILLLLDDLGEFACRLEEDQARQLLWLISNGPAVQIWTLATLDVGHLNGLDQQLIQCFTTWFIGQIPLGQLGSLPDSLRAAHPEQLYPGEEFCTFFNWEWIRFWIPKA